MHARVCVWVCAGPVYNAELFLSRCSALHRARPRWAALFISSVLHTTAHLFLIPHLRRFATLIKPPRRSSVPSRRRHHRVDHLHRDHRVHRPAGRTPPTQHNTTQHNTTQHNTTQRNTTQHNATQHNRLSVAASPSASARQESGAEWRGRRVGEWASAAAFARSECVFAQREAARCVSSGGVAVRSVTLPPCSRRAPIADRRRRPVGKGRRDGRQPGWQHAAMGGGEGGGRQQRAFARPGR